MSIYIFVTNSIHNERKSIDDIKDEIYEIDVDIDQVGEVSSIRVKFVYIHANFILLDYFFL